MNCRGCRQRFLPLPDLSKKIEGDSVLRVRIFRDTLILVFVNEKCCLCICFTKLYFFY